MLRAAATARKQWGRDTNATRAKRLKWLVQEVKSCTREQWSWVSPLDPEIAEITACKRVPAMRKVSAALAYDDMDGVQVWEQGVSTVGVQAASGVYKATYSAVQPRPVKDVLRAKEEWQQYQVGTSSHAAENLWSKTMAWVPAQLEGLYEVSEVPYERWASGKRFLKEEDDDKQRDIDDKTEGGLAINSTVRNCERPRMPGLAGAIVLFHFPLLSWPAVGLRGGAKDCDAAFSSLPLRPDERCQLLPCQEPRANFFQHKAGYFWRRDNASCVGARLAAHNLDTHVLTRCHGRHARR